MASKGKKGRGGKGKTLNLTEFLGGDGSNKYSAPGAAGTVAVEIGTSWADQMEEGEAMYERDSGRPAQKIVLPTGPAANFGPDIDDDKIPKYPPFTAYIANLPYDVDEAQVQEVFERARLKIKQVRLMKDEGGRLRGYGYADFEDRDSLIDVLTMTDLAVNNRKMRIDLASQVGKGGGGPGGADSDRPRREEDPDAGRSDASDNWRRGPPPAPREGYEGRDSGGGDRDRGRDGGRDRDGGGRSGFGGSGGGYEPPRDRGGFDRDRGGDRYGDRDGGRSGGGGFGDRDRGGDRYGDRDRGGSARDRLQEAPKERPKLALAPRTAAKVEEEGGTASASIFGGAKPVDRVEKEKDMAERREKEEKEREEARNKPKSNPFGSAKPVDVTKREKEMEDKLSKLTVKAEDKEVVKPPIENAWRVRKTEGSEDSKPASNAYRPPGASERDRGGSDRRDDRGGYDRDRRDDRGGGGYDRDRRDDRGGGGYDRDRRDGGGYDRDRRDDRGGGGYDRDRRDGGGYDRDRRDDRGGDRRDDRRDDRGGSDRRDDRGSDRRDDRGSDRRDDRGSDRKDDRGSERREGSSEKTVAAEERGKSPRPEGEKPMPKVEEPKPVAVATNKFAFLQEEGSGGSGQED